MTPEEMIAYASKIADGGKFKVDEIRAFMRALVDDSSSAAAVPEQWAVSTTVDAPVAHAPAPDAPAAVASALAPPPVPIRVIPNGVHLPIGANRWYTPREAVALGEGLIAAGRDAAPR